jgi:hypothetical protein
MAAAAPFVLISIFSIVEAIPLGKRGDSTGGFGGPTQLGPWRVPFWASILIIGTEPHHDFLTVLTSLFLNLGLIVAAGLGLLICLIRFLISISCWSLCWSPDVLLAEEAVTHDELSDTQAYDQPHIRTYSVHSNGSAYSISKAENGNIAPYHQYTLSNDQQQQERNGPEVFPWMFIPTPMLTAKPPSSVSPRPSSELTPIRAHPHGPARLEHNYRSSHASAPY